MAIFDIFEEVSEKATQKTETGDNRIFGVVIGEVTDNYSVKFPGRVCVSIHVRDSEANVLRWARVAMPSGGSEYGMYFLPEVGDQVLVVFEQGIIDRPYIIGCIQKNNNKFLTQSKSPTNQHKRIVTRHGSAIEFEDMPGPNAGESGDGSLDKISIHTAENAHEVTLDNAKKQITIKDKESETKILMKSVPGKGEMQIYAGKKMVLKVGDNISITMNGVSGKMTIKAKDIVMDATGKVTVSGGGKMALSGATIQANSNGMMKLSANGIVSIAGKPIKLG